MNTLPSCPWCGAPGGWEKDGTGRMLVWACHSYKPDHGQPCQSVECENNVLCCEIERLKNWERPAGFPEIVCLCGSTRFMDAFHEAGWQLTLDGYIVLTVGVCKHAEDHGGEALGEEVAAKLDELHRRKIDLADWVFVLNVGGYIGESTRNEIKYATAHRKQVTYLEPEATEAKGE